MKHCLAGRKIWVTGGASFVTVYSLVVDGGWTPWYGLPFARGYGV
jgi:hypothetical protein